ncbi:hypothetical protein U8V72_17495 [Priestia filamentosa]|uniref:hypothetical protein n=1 Tax=Priestia filamentosa TaxID=1402861 RepID=UPI003978E401
MNNHFSNAKKTTKLPSGIRVVSREKNLYEEKDIKKAGYKLYQKIESKSAGNFTVWRHPLEDSLLMFIEQPNGFYQFGGYMAPGMKK